jgi:hypothetical protein
MGSGPLQPTLVILFARVGGISSTSLSRRLLLRTDPTVPIRAQEELCIQPDSLAVSYTVHRQDVLVWRSPNRATAITTIFVASAYAEARASKGLPRITTIVRRCDEYRLGNTLFRIRNTSSSYVTKSSTFHKKVIPARGSFPHQLNVCRIGHCNLLPDLNSNGCDRIRVRSISVALDRSRSI